MRLTKEQIEKGVDKILGKQEENIINTLCYLYVHTIESPKDLIKKYYNSKITEDQLEPLVQNTKDNLLNDIWLFSVLKRNKEKIIKEYDNKDLTKCLK